MVITQYELPSCTVNSFVGGKEWVITRKDVDVLKTWEKFEDGMVLSWTRAAENNWIEFVSS